MDTKSTESICLELECQRENGVLFLNTGLQINVEETFNDISASLNKKINKYKNVLLAGDLNVDPLYSLTNHLFDLIDSFNSTNLVKEDT